LLWSVQLRNRPLSLTALTAPLIAADVPTQKGIKTLVYVAGSSDHVFALDASTGRLVWTRTLTSDFLLPKYPSMWLCPNNLNATPTIDRRAGLIYVLASDGRLYGLELSAGQTKFGPVPFVRPYSKDWSLNLIRGVIYTTASQGCADTPSGIYAIDLRLPMSPVIHEFLVGRLDAGIWGRGGVTTNGSDRIYAATGDGSTEPLAGLYGSSAIALEPSKMMIKDYYTPKDHQMLNHFDQDLGASSPAWFASGNAHLIAVGGKGGTLYLLNADRLGSGDHETALQTLRLSNDERAYERNGIWGGFGSWRDVNGDVWLYVPVWGPVSKAAPTFPIHRGPVSNGSLMAFKVKYSRSITGATPRAAKPRLEAQWISRDFNRPEPPVIANGVVFGLSTGENPQQTVGAAVVTASGHYGERSLTVLERMQNTTHAVLYALDARTGRTLYSSGDAIKGWVHFSGIAVANGRIYVVDHDSRLYCFGLRR
jgi:outer membrane protein assembly factor BamB